jgi:WD40 repeat protein
LLAVSAVADKGRVGERSVVEVWEVRDGERLRVIEVPRGWRGAYAVAFAPDATLLAVGGHRKFGVFDARTGVLLAEASHAGARFFGTETEQAYDLGHLSFSPDGGQLLTGGNDGTVKLWRVARLPS